MSRLAELEADAVWYHGRIKGLEAELAEARVENERLRVVVGAREMSRDNYKKMALELAEENERLLAAMGSMHEAEPECAEMGCSVCAALARPTGGPRED